MNTKKGILKKELDKNKCFNNISENNIVSRLARLLAPKLSLEMRIQFAITYLCFYVSMFRISIYDNYGMETPINNYMWGFAPSGTGKDTSYNILNEIFSSSFNRIRNILSIEVESRNIFLKENSMPLITLPNFIIGTSTVEGINKSLNVLSSLSMGSLMVYDSEMLQTLNGDVNALPMLSTLASLYDKGNKLTKNIKNSSEQLADVSGAAVSTMFLSAFDPIYANDKLKNKIETLFATQYSRRSNVTLLLDKPPNVNEEFDYDQWIKDKMFSNAEYSEAIQKAKSMFFVITNKILENKYINHKFRLSDEAFKLFLTYSEFNHIRGVDIIDKIMSINLMYRHIQAFKISGALATMKIFHRNSLDNEISLEEMQQAIQIVEMVNNDFMAFKDELTKHKFEVIHDMLLKTTLNKREGIISNLFLVKNGFVNDKKIDNDIETLVKLINLKDTIGITSIDKINNCIKYNRVEPTIMHEFSYKKLDREYDKAELLGQTKDGYQTITTTFAEIGDKICDSSVSTMYSPFKFKDGIRNKEHLINEISFIVLDIDKSDISAKDMHMYLSYLNHHIMLTSDCTNDRKYRIIFELSHKVSIEGHVWKKVLKIIAETYMPDIKVDELPQAQIFFGYPRREKYSVLNGEKIDIRNILVQANKTASVDVKTLPPKVKKEALDDFYNTFFYAFNLGEGQRNTTLIRAINHLYDLNGSKEQAIELVNMANDSFYEPLSYQEIERNIYPHINKKWR